MSGSLFPSRLRLFVDPGTVQEDESHVSRTDFYVSSLTHDSTGEPLVSIASHGNGMRITKAQAAEIRDWLDAWIAE